MTSHPQPQRCSWLCNHYEFVSPNTDCGGWVKCKLSGMELTMQQFLQMEVTGCASHTPAAPATEYTIEQIAEINNRTRKAREDEREKMLEEICEPATDENKKDGWKLNVKWLVDIHRNIRNEGDNLCLEDIESVLLALKESLRGGGAP